MILSKLNYLSFVTENKRDSQNLNSHQCNPFCYIKCKLNKTQENSCNQSLITLLMKHIKSVISSQIPSKETITSSFSIPSFISSIMSQTSSLIKELLPLCFGFIKSYLSFFSHVINVMKLISLAIIIAILSSYSHFPNLLNYGVISLTIALLFPEVLSGQIRLGKMIISSISRIVENVLVPKEQGPTEKIDITNLFSALNVIGPVCVGVLTISGCLASNLIDPTLKSLESKISAIPRLKLGICEAWKVFKNTWTSIARIVLPMLGYEWIEDEKFKLYKDHIRKITNEFNNPQRTKKIAETKYNTYIRNLFIDGTEMSLRLDDEEVPRSLQIMFSNALKLSKEMAENALHHIGDKAFLRPEPLLIHIYSEPGQGKSVAVSALGLSAAQICSNSIDPALEIYCPNVSQDHFDGYTGEKVWIYDDAFQQRDSPGLSRNEFIELIKVVNSFPMRLKMADLSEKNAAFCRAEVVFTTSNVQNPANFANEMNDKEALTRRFTKMYKLIVDEKYKKNHNGNLIVDPLKIKELLNVDVSLSIFKFQEYTINGSAVRNIGQPISYADVVNSIRISKTKKNSDFKERISVLNSIYRDGYSITEVTSNYKNYEIIDEYALIKDKAPIRDTLDRLQLTTFTDSDLKHYPFLKNLPLYIIQNFNKLESKINFYPDHIMIDNFKIQYDQSISLPDGHFISFNKNFILCNDACIKSNLSVCKILKIRNLNHFQGIFEKDVLADEHFDYRKIEFSCTPTEQGNLDCTEVDYYAQVLKDHLYNSVEVQPSLRRAILTLLMTKEYAWLFKNSVQIIKRNQDVFCDYFITDAHKYIYDPQGVRVLTNLFKNCIDNQEYIYEDLYSNANIYDDTLKSKNHRVEHYLNEYPTLLPKNCDVPWYSFSKLERIDDYAARLHTDSPLAKNITRNIFKHCYERYYYNTVFDWVSPQAKNLPLLTFDKVSYNEKFNEAHHIFSDVDQLMVSYTIDRKYLNMPGSVSLIMDFIIAISTICLSLYLLFKILNVLPAFIVGTYYFIKYHFFTSKEDKEKIQNKLTTERFYEFLSQNEPFCCLPFNDCTKPEHECDADIDECPVCIKQKEIVKNKFEDLKVQFAKEEKILDLNGLLEEGPGDPSEEEKKMKGKKNKTVRKVHRHIVHHEGPGDPSEEQKQIKNKNNKSLRKVHRHTVHHEGPETLDDSCLTAPPEDLNGSISTVLPKNINPKLIPDNVTVPFQTKVLNLPKEEGILDQGAIQVLDNLVLPNSYYALYSLFPAFDETGKLIPGVSLFKFGNLLFIKNRIAITTTHLIKTAQSKANLYGKNYKECYFYLFQEASPKPYTMQFKDIEKRIDLNSSQQEISLLVFPTEVRDHVDITRHFISIKDNSKVDYSGIAMYTHRFNNKSQIVLHRMFGPEVTVQNNVEYRALSGEYKNCVASFKYPLDTTSGDCGSPVVIRNNNIRSKIIGLHYAGGIGHGYAFPIFHEDIVDVLNTLASTDDEHKITNEGPSDTTLDITVPTPQGAFLPVGTYKYTNFHNQESTI